MDFIDVIKKRHSIRSFKKDDVEDEKLKKILDTMNTAPSAGNLQAYRVYVVKDKEKLKKLSDASLGQYFIAQAPLALVFFADPMASAWRYGKRGAELYSIQDATIATTFAWLQAVELGLSSVWVGAFIDSEVSRVIGAPSNLRPVAILPIGYAGEEGEITPRKSINEIVKFT